MQQQGDFVSGTVLVMCGQKHMQQQGDFVSVYNISCVLRNTCSSRETL